MHLEFLLSVNTVLLIIESMFLQNDDAKLAPLKNYLKLCGIRVLYAVVLKECKSFSAKKRKLQGILEEHGMDGKFSFNIRL